MTSKTTPENKLTEIVNRFIETKNKDEFLKSFQDWIISTNAELKSQNIPDEEIGKKVGEICFRAGQTVANSDDMLKDVLASALLNFFVGYKHRRQPD